MAITLSTKPATDSYNFANDPFIVKGTANSATNVQKRVVAQVTATMLDATVYTLPQLFYDVGSDDLFEFNFRENFSKLFERIDHSFPNPGTTSILMNNKNIVLAICNFYEYDGAEHALVDSDTFSCFVIRGGVSWEQFYSLDYLTAYQTANKSFLNWDLNGKELLADQDEYLTFLQPLGITGWKLKVTCYNNLGASVGTFDTLVPGTTNAVATYTIPVGFTQLGLDAVGYTASIYEWRVEVLKSSDNSSLSEVKSFILNSRHFRNKRYFFYENSLGGVSSLLTTGESELSIELSKTVVSNHQPVDYTVVKGQRKTINVTNQKMIKVQTGFKSRDEILALQEQIQSAFIVEIVEVPTSSDPEKVFFPIELTSTTVKVDKDNDFLHSLELTYKYNFKNTSYSPL